MKIINHKIKADFFMARRLVYGQSAEASKPPEVTPASASEQSDHWKQLSLKDVEAGKATIDQKVKKLPAEVQAALQPKQAECKAKLDAITARLKTAEDFKDQEIAAIKQEVDAAINDLLQSPFSKFTLDSFTCKLDPPKPVSEYEQQLEQFTQTTKVARAYMLDAVKDGEIKLPNAIVNGTLDFQIILSKTTLEKQKLPAGTIKEVTVTGNQVMEHFTSPEQTAEQTKADAFNKAFEDWKQSNGDWKFTYEYGTPPQKQTVDLSYFKYMPKAEITVALINQYVSDLNDGTIREGEPYYTEDGRLRPEYKSLLDQNGNLKVPPLFRPQYENDRIISKTVKVDAHGKIVPVVETDISTNIADKNKIRSSTKEYDDQGNLKKETADCQVVVNQQTRQSRTVTEYYPSEKGQPAMVKQVEQYDDGVIVKRSTFKPNGQLDLETVNIKDTPDVTGETRLTTIQLANGKTVEAYTTVMKIREGDKTVEVPNFALWLSQNPEQNQKSAEQSYNKYKNYLATVLVKDGKPDYDRINGFINIMFQYTHDNKVGDKANRVKNPHEVALSTLAALRINDALASKMRCDCKGYAALINDVLLAGNVKPPPTILSIPGHVASVYLSKTADGKYQAASFDTFGAQPPKKSFATPQEALASLQPKWSSKNSGQPALRDGTLFQGDIELVPIKDKFGKPVLDQKTGQPTFKAVDSRLALKMLVANSEQEMNSHIGKTETQSEPFKDGDATYVMVYGQTGSAKVFLNKDGKKNYDHIMVQQAISPEVLVEPAAASKTAS